MTRAARYPKRASSTEWRRGMGEIRRLVAEAEAARGKARRALLVRAARIVVDLECGEPLYPRRFKARRAAIHALEIAVGTLARDCVGCLAMERLDGEPPSSMRREATHAASIMNADGSNRRRVRAGCR